ncbi:MAG: IS66 family transposase [Clostridia bacterium]|nr:IS66 family transposase [Clostridia bacterium]
MDVLMQNIDLVLKAQRLLTEESPLSPKKELDYRTVITGLTNKTTALEEENAELKQQVANYKKLIYGQKSEKSEIIFDGGEQMSIFNEAEENAAKEVREREKDVIVPEHKRKSKRTHEETFENLPVEEVIHEVEDKECPECGEQMETVGKEFVRDELVYVPARLFVRKHYAEVVKCTACGEDESKDNDYADVPSPVFRKAITPASMIPHSFCSPELLAHILYEKYVMAVPLERQSKDFKAMGMRLSTATLSNWVIHAAENFMKPIYDRMKSELLTCSVIHADETVVQVLNEPNKKANTDSRMWVYCAGKYEGHNNILFEYTPTRNGDNARKFLGDYSGYLVCDGYDGYNKLTGAIRCGCWAHARRKFAEALPVDKALLANSAAAKGVELCNEIFILERELEGKDSDGRIIKEHLTANERHEQRQERLKPILDGLFAYLNELPVSGGTKLAKAVQYCLNEKTYLYRCLEDGNIPVDNNRAENAIRPFVVGRKNWLFANSVKGAEASAVIYSLAATATANGLNVEEYFTRLCKKEFLMPWNTLE